jgi:hypothetical protein
MLTNADVCRHVHISRSIVGLRMCVCVCVCVCVRERERERERERVLAYGHITRTITSEVPDF